MLNQMHQMAALVLKNILVVYCNK